MSELKFSCPNCGQHLSAEEAWVGSQIQCPSCQTQIVVPRLPTASLAAAAPPVLASGVPAPAPLAPSRMPASAPALCGLAVASLALALSTVPLNVISVRVGFPVGLLGCIPAVVCGHLALGKIAQGRGLRGAALAKWGLGLGYFFTLVGAVSLVILAYAKVTGADLQAGKKRRGDYSYRSTSKTPAKSARPSSAEEDPAGLASPKVAPAPVDPPIATDPNTVAIPMKAAAGTLRGKPFAVEKATFSGGCLDLAQGKGFMPEAQIKMFLFLKPGESLAERTIVVTPQSAQSNPHIHLMRQDGIGKNSTLTGQYALRLEFGKLLGKRIPFKLYFEAPQSYETLVSGNYVADLQ